MRHGWQLLTEADRDEVFQSLASGAGPARGPFHLEIDPVDACNARCWFCNSKAFRNGAILAWDRLERLLKDASGQGLRSVRLAGGGEPTLFPQWIELMACLQGLGVRIDNLTTNGLRLQGPIAESALRVAPEYVMVSLNYATPERYARAMGLPAERFHQVCDNLKAFREGIFLGGHDGRCQLHVQFMISRESLGDLRAMFELAARFDVGGMTLRALSGLSEADRLTAGERGRFMTELTALAREYKSAFWIMFDLGLEGLGAEAAALTGELYGGGSPAPAPEPSAPNQANLDDYRFCLLPWYSMAVLGSGLVYPCCFLIGEDSVTPLGDVNRQTLAEIWTGAPFRRYRNEIRRSMLLGGSVPMWSRLCVHTTAACWRAGVCPLSRNPPGPEDTARLAGTIQAMRSTPAGGLTRLYYGALRKGIDVLRAAGSE